MGKCKNCRHWIKIVGVQAGNCHRYPPTVLTDGKDNKFWQWPKTDNNEGCGEFEQETV